MKIVWTILKGLGLLILLAVIGIVGWPWVAVMKDKPGSAAAQAWLEENKTVLDQDQADLGLTFSPAFYENKLVLLSEMHGFGALQGIDLAMVRHLSAKVGLRAYYAELSPAAAMAFNIYLETGDDTYARQVFDRWASITAQWANTEFFDKLTAIRALNDQLPEGRKIWFFGIDALDDRDFAEAMAVLPMAPAVPGFESYAEAQALNARLLADTLDRSEDATRYDHFLANTRLIMLAKGAEDEHFYGLWGLGHSAKTLINGFAPLALRLAREGGYFEDSVGTISTACAGVCLNMIPAMMLPGPFQGKAGEEYTWLPMRLDNPYLNRLSGVDDLKAVAGEADAVLFNVSGEGNPFTGTSRLLDMHGYLNLVLETLTFGGSVDEAYDAMIFLGQTPGLTPWDGEAFDVSGGQAEF